MKHKIFAAIISAVIAVTSVVAPVPSFAGGTAVVAHAAQTVSAPTANYKSGTHAVTGAITVKLSSATKGATIYYSLNGASYKKYTQSFKVSKNSTLKAYSKYDGVKSSTVTYTYKLKPKLSIKTTDNSKGKLVKLSTNVTNVKLYYTLDGTKPTTKSKQYTSSGIQITKSCTLRILSVKSGWTSGLYSKQYTIKEDKLSQKGHAYFDTPAVGKTQIIDDGVKSTEKATYLALDEQDRIILNIGDKKCVRIGIAHDKEFETGDTLTLADFKDKGFVSLDGFTLIDDYVTTSIQPNYFDKIEIKGIKLDYTGKTASEIYYYIRYYDYNGTKYNYKGNLFSIEGVAKVKLTGSHRNEHADHDNNNNNNNNNEQPSGSTSTHNCALCKDTHICVICDGTGVHFGNVCGICHGSKICYLCAGTNPTAPNTTSYACAACLHGKCRPCSGTGKVWGWKQKITCSLCGGDGICSACHGTGIVTITY